VSGSSATLASVVEVAVASRPHPESSRCGDSALVQLTGYGALLAVFDGLGHGDDAAEAAELALHTVRELAEHDVEAILQACHRALHRSRGGVIGLAAVNERADELHWVGVGNIEGLVRGTQGERCRPTSSPGIVGSGQFRLHRQVVRFAPGDLLMMATDGIGRSAFDDIAIADTAEETAQAILFRHARPNDDALVLIARRQRGRGAPSS